MIAPGSSLWTQEARRLELVKGMPWSVPIGMGNKDFIPGHAGEYIDPESNLPHIGHVFCNRDAPCLY